jgi:hypothetical protein
MRRKMIGLNGEMDKECVQGSFVWFIYQNKYISNESNINTIVFFYGIVVMYINTEE